MDVEFAPPSVRRRYVKAMHTKALMRQSEHLFHHPNDRQAWLRMFLHADYIDNPTSSPLWAPSAGLHYKRPYASQAAK